MFWRTFIDFWESRSLIARFTMAGGAVLIVVTLLSGAVITSFVRSNVLYHRAAATALYVDSAIVRHLDSLQPHEVISDFARSQLDQLFEDEAFVSRTPHLEIWSANGTILYSNTSSLIGQQFELPDGAVAAFEGLVVAGESDLSSAEHEARDFRQVYTEIYSPIRGQNGEVVAVSEIHDASRDIGRSLAEATTRSWAAVGLACLAFFLTLYSIVWRASHKLERQERILSSKLAETTDLAERNGILREQAVLASRLMTEHNDHFLSTVGADLHDGPSQLISFAVLKVEKARRAKTRQELEAELGEIETNLSRALNEVRNIARGLVLPAIDEGTLADAIGYAINMHRERTGMDVDCDIELGAFRSTASVNICAYRFLQEGLNNAFRHGSGDRARVEANLTPEGALEMRVISHGRSKRQKDGPLPGIGLSGLKARINSLGGQLRFTRLDELSVLEMTLDVSGEGEHV